MFSSRPPDVNSIHKNYFTIRRWIAGKCKGLTYRGLIIEELDYKGYYNGKKKKTTLNFLEKKGKRQASIIDIYPPMSYHSMPPLTDEISKSCPKNLSGMKTSPSQAVYRQTLKKMKLNGLN
jgi:hypothetical protein